MIPKISVLMPVFNTAQFLPGCIDSVLSQSFSDIELIAVNDASTDDSPRILADYAAKDPRIRVVHHERNKGLLAARITGIREARGKYIQFLDSDDALMPDILSKAWETAEKKQADIVHFPLAVRRRDPAASTEHCRIVQKSSRPWKTGLQGREIFRNFFVDNAYIWMVCQKLYRTELCRKAIGFIPDQFCLMAEDFCLYSLCAFLAERYVPLHQPGYVYYLDSGISSGQKTTLDKFLNRQSPFQALRNVRNFLTAQGVWEEYQNAFAKQEQVLLGEYVLRWMRHLPDEDRTKAFNDMFRKYDAFPLFQAFRTFFSDKDELFLEMLSGDDPDPVLPPEKTERTAENLSLRNTRISNDRWLEWQTLIRENHYDAVILSPDDDLERLFWDIQAIRSAGAAAVCRREKPYLDTLDRNGLNVWLMEDRTLRQASVVLVPDEASAEWYRSRNCAAGISLEKVLPPQRSEQTSVRMLALEKSEKRSAYYRIDPSDDGETFVPFFRKLDHLFRKLPGGFRKKLFRGLAGIYNRICGH